jgi:Domain of unknown function (DUF6458)
MGVPVSLVLIAAGAILAFAVNQDSSGSVDIDVVGWILMIVGLVGLLLSLLLWERLGPGYWGRHRTASYPADAPPPRRRSSYPPRRREVIEEEDAPPAGPPP